VAYLTVFVVDDEPVIADTLAMILQACGVTTRVFYNGQDALKAASQEQPDFVISDVLMPKMDGFELATQLKKRFPRCQILLISGSIAVQQDSPKAGFEILNKPIPPEILIQRILAAKTKLEAP
jgi:CheY-like chemotaxis protein